MIRSLLEALYVSIVHHPQLYNSVGRNDVEGGRSSLLDVFPVINELRTKFPQHFTTLTEVPATFSRFKTPDQRYVCEGNWNPWA